MKILVIKPSSLGDIVHGLQVIKSLRVQKKGVEVTWVVRELFAPIVEASGVVEKVIIFERKRGFSGWWTVLKEIRRQHYDWILDMQGLARSALWCRFSRGENKVGRADGREFANFFIRKKVTLPLRGKGAHAVEILLEYLKLWDLPAKLAGTLSFKEATQAENPEGITEAEVTEEAAPPGVRLSQGNSSGTPLQKLWVVFPESRRAEKEWPYLYEACLEWLKRDSELHLVALAGKSHTVPEKLNVHPRWNNLMGKTALIEMVSWIQKADGVITNDSGPMHIAAAMDKRLLALFGATSAEQYGPYPLSNPRFQILTSSNGQMEGLTLEKVLSEGIVG